MRKINKILSILLCTAMLVTCIQIPVVVAEDAGLYTADSIIYEQDFEDVTSLSSLGSEWDFGITETTNGSMGWQQFTADETGTAAANFEIVTEGDNTYLSTVDSVSAGASIKLDFGADNYYLGEGGTDKIYSVSFRAKIPASTDATVATDVCFIALSSNAGVISPVGGFNHRSTEKIDKLFGYYTNSQGRTSVAYDTWHDVRIEIQKPDGSSTAKFSAYLNDTMLNTALVTFKGGANYQLSYLNDFVFAAMSDFSKFCIDDIKFCEVTEGEAPEPTEAPTSEPTTVPTEAPTTAPTSEPTTVPDWSETLTNFEKVAGVEMRQNMNGSLWYDNFSSSIGLSSSDPTRYNVMKTSGADTTLGYLVMGSETNTTARTTVNTTKNYFNPTRSFLVSAKYCFPYASSDGLSFTAKFTGTMMYSIVYSESSNKYNIYMKDDTNTPIASILPGEWFVIKAAFEPDYTLQTQAEQWANSDYTLQITVLNSDSSVKEAKQGNGKINVVHSDLWGLRNADGGNGSASLELGYILALGQKGLLYIDELDVYEVNNADAIPEDVKVNQIRILPSSLSVPANFDLPCKLEVEINPSLATNKAIEWISSNTEVAKVDENGNVTVTGEGTTEITARALDGGGAVSNTFTLTVTPPEKEYTGNQLKNLPAADTPRINIDDYLNWPAIEGDANIALWQDNRTGALTITVDDNIKNDFAQWNEWADEHGINFTFFAPTGSDSASDESKNAWLDLISHGNEVASHSTSHLSGEVLDSISSGRMAYEYMWPTKVIEDATGQKVKAIAYSYGHYSPDYAKYFYSAGRGTRGTPNHAATVDYMCTNSLSGLPGTIYGTSETAEAAIKTTFDRNYSYYGSYYGGWTSVHWHNIGSTSDALEEILANIIAPAINDGKLWATTFTNVALYGQERDTATLTVTEKSDNLYKLTLTDMMADDIFDVPLTVKIKVNDSWKEVSAAQNGKTIDAKIVTNNEGTFVMLDAVPDKGEITVKNPGADDEIIIGDITGDGSINPLDRANLSRYVAKWDNYETLTNEGGADINRDGNINALDRAILSRHLAKWDGYESIPLK